MLKDLFRSKQKYLTEKREGKKREVPDGLWTRCEPCGAILYNKELEQNLGVCIRCGYHFRIGAWERVAQLVDPGTFAEWDADLVPGDPLAFPEYPEKVSKSQKKTGLTEAIITGRAYLAAQPVAIGIIDFGFIGGTMGSVVGEKVARAFERAADERLPVISVSAGGGGARMQEGILSLMQMAKTCQAVGYHTQAGRPYISVLTDPTMGGIYASFASLGDIILAEPGALIGFAGPRIVAETIRQKLPAGFQSAEFALQNGMIDRIVERKELKPTLARLLRYHAAEVS